MTGTVKWYQEAKGVGMIAPDIGGMPFRVRREAIQGEGYQTLSEGDHVLFDVALGHQGREAKNVVKL